MDPVHVVLLFIIGALGYAIWEMIKMIKRKTE